MKEEDRNQLIANIAVRAHEAWFEKELREFYSRYTAEVEKGENIVTALRNACCINGKQRNELELDSVWLMFHEIKTARALQTFDGFLSLFDKKVIEVKRFVKSTLTEEEQKKVDKRNYNAERKAENILRPFDELSADAQKKRLEAAESAVYVYEENAKRGVTFD